MNLKQLNHEAAQQPGNPGQEWSCSDMKIEWNHDGYEQLFVEVIDMLTCRVHCAGPSLQTEWSNCFVSLIVVPRGQASKP